MCKFTGYKTYLNGSLKIKNVQWTPYCPRTEFADKVFFREANVMQYGSLVICSIRIDLLENTPDEYIYIVNYYGQLDEDAILALKKKYGNIIVDNTQAYFNAPLEGIDTLYSCRKYFGVPDGGVLFTDAHFDCDMEQEISYDRMNFLLGRYEKTASEFYPEYVATNDYFDNQPMKRMSKLTKNLLHGIDYEFVKQRRTENFRYLHDRLGKINQLKLTIPCGAFAYPLMLDNAGEIRKQLIKQKIYIPVLWPNVLDECAVASWEYKLASDVLPLPVDQRYDLDDM